MKAVRMPAILDERLHFPDPRAADGEGLVAIGGDLSVSRLRLAYRSGIFPWTVNPITWWSPDPRAIFNLQDFHEPRSLVKFLRKQRFAFTHNRAFRRVMEGCAAPASNREETWITPEFIEAYTRLRESGDAHSVECWHNGELVGGIYGVSIGGFFAGESMFRRTTNASKAALCHLVQHLRNRGFTLFDIQMTTPVTRQLGALAIPRIEYLRRLAIAVEVDCSFG
jgi:leucyl/phenylalanyl-tRNA---protein transferase